MPYKAPLINGEYPSTMDKRPKSMNDIKALINSNEAITVEKTPKDSVARPKGGRPKGSINKRNLFIPSDTVLNMLHYRDLLELRRRINRIVNKKQRCGIELSDLRRVFDRVFELLNGKTLVSPLHSVDGSRVLLARGTVLDRDLLLQVPFRLMLWIDIGDHSVHSAVWETLGRIRRKDGHLLNFRPLGEIDKRGHNDPALLLEEDVTDPIE